MDVIDVETIGATHVVELTAATPGAFQPPVVISTPVTLRKMSGTYLVTATGDINLRIDHAVTDTDFLLSSGQALRFRLQDSQVLNMLAAADAVASVTEVS